MPEQIFVTRCMDTLSRLRRGILGHVLNYKVVVHCSVFVKINTSFSVTDSRCFSALIPISSCFVFGSLNSGSSDVSFRIALINQSDKLLF